MNIWITVRPSTDLDVNILIIPG